jgi:hypothetical protein
VETNTSPPMLLPVLFQSTFIQPPKPEDPTLYFLLSHCFRTATLARKRTCVPYNTATILPLLLATQTPISPIKFNTNHKHFTFAGVVMSSQWYYTKPEVKNTQLNRRIA